MRDLFSPANPLFVEGLSRKESGRRHRFVVLTDDGLVRSEAALPDRTVAYAIAHEDKLHLLATPEFILGGERCKANPDLVFQL